MRITSKILFAVLMVFFIASSAAASEDAGQRIKAADLKVMVDKGETILIVDVRSPEEFMETHVTGALSVPLHQVAAKLSGMSPETKMAFY